MARNANRCPSCGERVSPFAAGCALCGASLDPRRHDRRGLRLPRPRRPPGGSLPSSDAFAVAVLILLTVFAPLIGLLVCGLRAYGQEQAGHVRQRNIALALAAVCFVFLLLPVWQVDLLRRLGLP